MIIVGLLVLVVLVGAGVWWFEERRRWKAMDNLRERALEVELLYRNRGDGLELQLTKERNEHFDRIGAYRREWRDERIALVNAHVKEHESFVLENESLKCYSDFVIGDDHEWCIGGRQAIHGREPRIKFECAQCKAVVFAPEETFVRRK